MSNILINVSFQIIIKNIISFAKYYFQLELEVCKRLEEIIKKRAKEYFVRERKDKFKMKKLLIVFLMIAVLLPAKVYANSSNIYTFTLGNTGTVFNKFTSNMDQKSSATDPWTLQVETINCSGNYGIRFAPAMCDSTGTVTRVCSESGRWMNATGKVRTTYDSGDAARGVYYKLAARQDSAYYNSFYSSGWYDAD